MTSGNDAITVTVAHTAHVAPELLRAAHDLMYVVFDDMTEDDWQHGLGGLHALALHGGEVVGHASLVQRRLMTSGRPLRCGYVEAVGVRPDLQRTGIGSLLMQPLEAALSNAYEVGALGASDDGASFYVSRGWQLWRGRLSVLTPDGITPTPDEEGGVYVWSASAALDLDSELTCDWRDGDVW